MNCKLLMLTGEKIICTKFEACSPPPPNKNIEILDSASMEYLKVQTSVSHTTNTQYISVKLAFRLPRLPTHTLQQLN